MVVGLAGHDFLVSLHDEHGQLARWPQRLGDGRNGDSLCRLAVHMLLVAEPSQGSVALLPLALLGAALGFLPHNFAPARIFMGSTGAYFLGYALAALGIIGGARLATVMLVLGLPALDLIWLVVNRWRRGVSPGQGGRDHLHFRLVDLGISERWIVVGYWLFCAAFGMVTLLLNGAAQKIIALSMLGALAIAVLSWATFATKAAPVQEID
ncbi:MAG: hypothetical protein R2932_27960 [Caldilineaceae bacterium]